MLFMFFLSCKRQVTAPEIPKRLSNEVLITKIQSWLDEQKKDLPANSIAMIESLKRSLIYDNLFLEKYRALEDFIIVPVSHVFKSKNNEGKNPVNYLVLVLKNKDSITRGNIIQYVSGSNQNLPPENTFSKIFTYKNIDCSGQFTVLSVTDFFKYELVFENGKLKSVADRTSRAAENISSGKVNNCISWFLITTIYYYDGSSSSYEEYLGTYCGDPECQDTRVINGRSLRINCGAGGGGNIEYEYALSKPLIWTVQYSVYWTVTSNETVSGIRKASEPQGGHFTSIVHGSSYLSRDDNREYSWQELANTMSVDHPQAVSAYVSGRLKRTTGTTAVYNGSTTATFATVFP